MTRHTLCKKTVLPSTCYLVLPTHTNTLINLTSKKKKTSNYQTFQVFIWLFWMTARDMGFIMTAVVQILTHFCQAALLLKMPLLLCQEPPNPRCSWLFYHHANQTQYLAIIRSNYLHRLQAICFLLAELCSSCHFWEGYPSTFSPTPFLVSQCRWRAVPLSAHRHQRSPVGNCQCRFYVHRQSVRSYTYHSIQSPSQGPARAAEDRGLTMQSKKTVGLTQHGHDHNYVLLFFVTS